MTARKRASANSTQAAEEPRPLSTDSPIAPSKSSVILKLSVLFSVPYLYLIFRHYDVDSELRRSILINAGISVVGYFAAVKLIPVASRSVLKRNLFGYDINKKGTPQGTVKV